MNLKIEYQEGKNSRLLNFFVYCINHEKLDYVFGFIIPVISMIIHDCCIDSIIIKGLSFATLLISCMFFGSIFTTRIFLDFMSNNEVTFKKVKLNKED